MLVSKSVLSFYEDIVQYQPPWINRNPSTSSANTKPLLPDLDTTRSVSSTSTTDLPDNFSIITDSSIFSKKVYFSFDFLFFSLQKVFDLVVVKKLLKKQKHLPDTTQILLKIIKMEILKGLIQVSPQECICPLHIMLNNSPT